MRLFILVSFCLLFLQSTHAQTRTMLWMDAGIKKEFSKKIEVGAFVNSRFDNGGLNVLFPSVYFKYKLTKWFRPSVEYRYIYERFAPQIYSDGNRINLNADFKYEIKQFELGFRLRYQFSFNALRNTEFYDAEFDQSFRFKPSLTYNIENSIFTPHISAEWFLNTSGGPSYGQITRLRSSLGTDIDLKGPHKMEVGVLFDYKFNKSNLSNVFIVNLGYQCVLKYKEKKKGRRKTIETL